MARTGKWPNREILIGLYKKEGSAEKVGKILGMHPHTVRKYLNLYQVKLRTGPVKGKRRWGSLSKWIKENPDVVLPPSVRGIAEYTGLSKNAVKSFLYRTRREAKALINEQPWKNGNTKMWENSLGTMIPDTAFRSVRSFVGITGKLKFVVRLKDGSPHIFYMTLKKFKELYR